MSLGLSMLATVLGLLVAAVGILDAAPYQELQPRAGYVPVYIREGETPLSEIHPRLAEAFHEVEHKKSEGSSSQEQGPSKLNDELVAPESPMEQSADESKEPNANVAEAAKEAIKELVSVFETEMLDKLGLGEEGTAESKPEAEKKSPQISDDSDKSESDSSEKPSDVLTVEDFKAKDFNKESITDEAVDVPEDVPSDE